jgi:hypothetical protein
MTIVKQAVFSIAFAVAEGCLCGSPESDRGNIYGSNLQISDSNSVLALSNSAAVSRARY